MSEPAEHENTSQAPAELAGGDDESDASAEDGWGTIAGGVAFVGAGLGTVLAAITDWGADDGGLAAARRNHVNMLAAAALLAISGLAVGALYALLRNKRHSKVLGFGVLLVVAGVACGIIATTRREPGRPTLGADRIDTESIRVTVRADGLSSDTSFDMEAYGMDKKDAYVATLATARFSPSQRGELDWSLRIAVPPKWQNKRISRVQVWVAPDVPSGKRSSACASGNPTCLDLIMATTPETS